MSETFQDKLERLRREVKAYRPGTFLDFKADEMVKSSREADDHPGYVYLIAHCRSSDQQIFEYVGETAVKPNDRLNFHFNTAFSDNTVKGGLTTGSLHHAMMLEYRADQMAYRSRFAIKVLRETIGPVARKKAETEEVDGLKARTVNHYNLAEGGGNRPAHLKHGLPVLLTIGKEEFRYASKTALWAALDAVDSPGLVRAGKTGAPPLRIGARSRWLWAEDISASLAQKVGLEPLTTPRRTSAPKTDRGSAPAEVWKQFHAGTAHCPRGDLRDVLEAKAEEAGISESLLEKRVFAVRYTAGVKTLEDAWSRLLLQAKPALKVAITLPGRAAEKRTLMEWGRFVNLSTHFAKVRNLDAQTIQHNLRNTVNNAKGAVSNDRFLHALGLLTAPRSRRKTREVFLEKSPTPRHLVPSTFDNPLTGQKERYESVAAMCRAHGVLPPVYFTSLRSGWSQAEALRVVLRKPPPKASHEYRAKYAAWLAALQEASRKKLEAAGLV